MTDVTDVLEILATNQKTIQEIVAKHGVLIRGHQKAIIDLQQQLVLLEDEETSIGEIDDLG